MSDNRICPATETDHTWQDYKTVMFGNFTACNKCGVRRDNRCPFGDSGEHTYQEEFTITASGVAKVVICKYCRTRP